MEVIVLTIRKNITLEAEDYDTIVRFCKKTGTSFSRFLRDAALTIIKTAEEQDLYTYLINNTSYVSDEEQEEFDTRNIDFEPESRELSLDDIL